MIPNPLKRWIDDDRYRILWKTGMLNERAVRDLYIQTQFRESRGREKPARVFDRLQKEFPYLAIASIRKIAYSGTPLDLGEQ